MAIIKMPYHKTYMEIEIPDRNLAGILTPKPHNSIKPVDQKKIVNEALDNPVGSPKLEDMAKGKDNIVIITSDHTRPVPSSITMPLLLGRIRKGNPQAKVTILIATGFHRPSTKEEMLSKFGQEIVDNEHIVNHISNDMDNMVFAGILPSGGELYLNRIAMEAELLISEGFIEPHFFAGFSGGRKSVLPGVAYSKTIMANHCAEFIESPHSRAGILENNPIHKDMAFAAVKARLKFILNVAIDGNKEIIGAFAGDCSLAHEEGCRFVGGISAVDKVTADIVVVSNGGYPLDQNIYQAVKGMTAAEVCCRKDGVIIIISSCCDGHGGVSFYENVKDSKSPRDLLERVLAVSRADTVPDQWEFQILARILDKYKVIMVTDMCNPSIIEDMHMLHASTFGEALEKAFEIKSRDAEIAVIPDGISVIVK